MDFKKKSKVNKQLLWVGLGSVIMFFGGLTSAYIVRKQRETGKSLVFHIGLNIVPESLS